MNTTETLPEKKSRVKPIIPALPRLEVRAELVRRGYSIKKWANERGFCDAYVNMSITGKRRGPKARKIVDELKEELGL